MNWYYKTDSGKIGPISRAEIEALAEKGVIAPETMVWNDYSGKWQTYHAAINGDGGDSTESWSPYGSTPSSGSYSTNTCQPPLYKPPFSSSSYAVNHQIEFTGSGSEYFRIWIVNLLLTVATLGIYSAWAKVRRNKYFYRNTRIAGSSFDYHGKPIAILKGRLIAAMLIVTLLFFKTVHPAYYVFGLFVFGAFLPWLVTKSLAFRMRNTSWRSIRFKFTGTIGQAAKLFYLYGLFSMFTAGLFYPLFYHRQKAFLYNNISFGQAASMLRVSAGQVYGVAIRTIGIVALTSIISTTILFPFLYPSSTRYLMFIIPVFIYLSALIVAYPFFQVRISNLIWNNLSLGPISFTSSLRFRKFASILISNAFLTFITLGLYWPWAAIKLTRYRIESLTLSAMDGLEQFEADSSAEVDAVGQEISDAYDFDISF